MNNDPPKTQHDYNKINAARYLKKLIDIETPQEKFYFLRSINPFVFEEMIMTALRNNGYKIIRNKAYTNDGGIDGRAYLDNQHYLIQAKRYKSHVKLQDIKDFAKICEIRKGKGLFIHTGKTGTKSREATYYMDVKIISGEKLLALLETPPPNDKI